MSEVKRSDIKVGDYVNFKCDIEQGGYIKKIKGNTLTLENENGFQGSYIGGQTETTETIDSIWLED